MGQVVRSTMPRWASRLQGRTSAEEPHEWDALPNHHEARTRTRVRASACRHSPPPSRHGLPKPHLSHLVGLAFGDVVPAFRFQHRARGVGEGERPVQLDGGLVTVERCGVPCSAGGSELVGRCSVRLGAATTTAPARWWCRCARQGQSTTVASDHCGPTTRWGQRRTPSAGGDTKARRTVQGSVGLRGDGAAVCAAIACTRLGS